MLWVILLATESHEWYHIGMIKEKAGQLSKHTLSVSAGLGIVASYILLVMRVSATSHKAGYLGYFGIDIRNVDYQPSIIDFIGEPLLVILAIPVLLAAFLLAAGIVNLVQWLLGRFLGPPLKWLARIVGVNISGTSRERVFDKRMIIGGLAALLVFLSFRMPLYDSYDRGIEFAKQKKDFAVLATESDRKQALVHQNQGLGLLKTYDPESGSFERGYEVIDLADKKFEHIRLIEK